MSTLVWDLFKSLNVPTLVRDLFKTLNVPTLVLVTKLGEMPTIWRIHTSYVHLWMLVTKLGEMPTIWRIHTSYVLLWMLGASAGVFSIVAGSATLLPNYTFYLLFLGPVRIKYIALFYILLSFLDVTGSNAGGDYLVISVHFLDKTCNQEICWNVVVCRHAFTVRPRRPTDCI